MLQWEVKDHQKLLANHQMLERGKEGFSPTGFAGSMALLTPSFQTFSFQNCEKIPDAVLNTLWYICGTLLWEPWGTIFRNKSVTVCKYLSDLSPVPTLLCSDIKLTTSSDYHLYQFPHHSLRHPHLTPGVSYLYLCPQAALLFPSRTIVQFC